MDTETPESPAPPSPPPFDPRRRLRELLSVPERDRTDAQWDEINELEIQLAPGNRAIPGAGSGTSVGAGAGAGNPRPFLQNQKKRPPKGDKLGGGKGRSRLRK
jgi:hypothetical protein